jgi:ribosomal protein S18 acetylase RimI-like enzyme
VLTAIYNAPVLNLRKYQPQDFERLLEIDTACFVEGIAYSEQEMRYFLRRPSSIRLVGEEEKEDRQRDIQGSIIADHFVTRPSKQRMGHIITIDVLPEARRHGLGSRLLDAVEKELKKLGCSHVSLETAVDNFAALHFYKQHGYTGLKILPRYYLNSIDALLMGKKL